MYGDVGDFLCAPVILTGIFSIIVVYNSAHAALMESMFCLKQFQWDKA